MATPSAPWDSWDLLETATARDPGTPRAVAAKRAIGIMRSVLGEDWLAANAAQIPSEIALAFSHTLEFVRLLELALRLEEFGSASGAAVLRRHLRTDRAVATWRHVELQLELAALAAAQGAIIEFEVAPGGGWPADVVATVDHRPIFFEAFSVFTSQGWRAADRASDEIVHRLLTPQIRHNLSIVANFNGRVLAPDELGDWLERVEAAADAVATDGEPRTITAGAVTATLTPAAIGPPSTFTGPPVVFNGWARMLGKLAQKRSQTSASVDGVWLRVDALDGMWQFTEWARYDLAQKLLVMERMLGEAFDATASLDGFILSTGSAWAQGAMIEESIQSERGSIALRRNLAPLRVRETLIVPLSDRATDFVEFLAGAYAAEPQSLDRSLQLAGLDTVDEVFPKLPPSPQS